MSLKATLPYRWTQIIVDFVIQEQPRIHMDVTPSGFDAAAAVRKRWPQVKIMEPWRNCKLELADCADGSGFQLATLAGLLTGN